MLTIIRRSFVTAIVGCGLIAALGAAPSEAPVAASAQSRDVQGVRALLKSGADVNAAQGDGMTALHWAAMHGDSAMSTMLLQAGANVRAQSRLGGYVPLHLAAQAGSAAVIDQLLARGAAVNQTTTTGATPLMLAASSGNVAAATRLMDGGAELNSTESAQGQTALMFAAALDRADVVKALIARGATVSTATKVIDLEALTAAPGEEALQQASRRPGQGGGGGGSGSAAAPAAPRAADIAGVTRPFRYNELIGRQGGLTAFCSLLGKEQLIPLPLCSTAAPTSTR